MHVYFYITLVASRSLILPSNAIQGYHHCCCCVVVCAVCDLSFILFFSVFHSIFFINVHKVDRQENNCRDFSFFPSPFLIFKSRASIHL